MLECYGPVNQIQIKIFQLQIVKRALNSRQYMFFPMRIVPQLGSNPQFFTSDFSRSYHICYCLTNFSFIPIIKCTIDVAISRSEEHTSELQSRENLVCRLLLEKKN